jgi:hypothetical protein
VYSRRGSKAARNNQLKLEEAMKVRTLALALALFPAVATLCVAEDLSTGTWKLNESKSQIPAGFIKNTTVVYSTEGDKTKIVTDGIGRDGKPMHTEWVGKLDGKDYPLTGDSGANSRSILKVDDHHMKLENKKDGKVAVSGSIVIAKDGKSRTLTATGTDSSGKKITSTTFYDKQ